MSTVVVNIRTEAEVKQKAQQVAKELGVSLSALINAYLNQLVRIRRVELTLDETPNEYLKAVILQAQENYKKGNTSPAFKTGEEAVAWLEKQGI